MLHPHSCLHDNRGQCWSTWHMYSPPNQISWTHNVLTSYEHWGKVRQSDIFTITWYTLLVPWYDTYPVLHYILWCSNTQLQRNTSTRWYVVALTYNCTQLYATIQIPIIIVGINMAAQSVLFIAYLCYTYKLTMRKDFTNLAILNSAQSLLHKTGVAMVIHGMFDVDTVLLSPLLFGLFFIQQFIVMTFFLCPKKMCSLHGACYSKHWSRLLSLNKCILRIICILKFILRTIANRMHCL